MQKSELVIKLEEDGLIEDVVTICPYCLNEVNSTKWDLGCCGEASTHFTEAYLMFDGEIKMENELHEYLTPDKLH